ncbi:MAG: hypothetical protein HUU55_02075 [Myxococcales bacterium]|nr:hypothetical protein [Myxococcales bacterium]
MVSGKEVSTKRKILNACGEIIGKQVERMNTWHAGVAALEADAVRQYRDNLDDLVRLYNDSMDYYFKIGAECRNLSVGTLNSIAGWLLPRG